MSPSKFLQLISPQPIRGRRTRIAAAALPMVISLTILLSAGCGKTTSQEKTFQPISVTTVRPQRSTVSSSVTLVGHVRPWEQAILYSKVAGYLEWIGVDRGSWVKQGEALATIDDPETGKDFKRQKADNKAKKIVYERLLAAIEKNPDMVSQLEIDRAKGDYETSLAGLERLQTLLDFAQIRAPYDGVITDRWVDPGALIQIGTTSQNPSARIVRIMNFDTVRIEVEIPEPDVPHIQQGRQAVVTLPENPEEAFVGQIARYSWAIDPTTRTMAAEVDVPNLDHKLRPGMFATVEIELQSSSEALVLPSEVVVVEGSKRFVWVVTNNMAKRIPIILGNDNGIQVEILEGLDGSEAVVTTGTQMLSEGDEVVVVETPQL